MKTVKLVPVFIIISFFFIFSQKPHTQPSPESPSYVNPEQAQEQDLQGLLTIWNREAKNYQTIMKNSKKKGDINSAEEYECKLKELNNRIDQVLPIMQKYD